jgi:hypothetical protein
MKHILPLNEWVRVSEAAMTKPIFAEGAPFAKIKDKGLTIMNKLIDTYGYSPILAAALCGNMFEESKFDPTAKSADGYEGLIQWGGPRLGKLKKLANWKSIDTQLSFIDSELKSNSYFIKTKPVKPKIDALTNTGSSAEEKAAAVSKAVDIVTLNYEGAAPSDLRRNSAKELYDLYIKMNSAKQTEQAPIEPAPEKIGSLPTKPAQPLS